VTLHKEVAIFHPEKSTFRRKEKKTISKEPKKLVFLNPLLQAVPNKHSEDNITYNSLPTMALTTTIIITLIFITKNKHYNKNVV